MNMCILLAKCSKKEGGNIEQNGELQYIPRLNFRSIVSLHSL